METRQPQNNMTRHIQTGWDQAESDWNTLFDLCVVNYMHYERGEIENPKFLWEISFSKFYFQTSIVKKTIANYTCGAL